MGDVPKKHKAPLVLVTIDAIEHAVSILRVPELAQNDPNVAYVDLIEPKYPLEDNRVVFEDTDEMSELNVPFVAESETNIPFVVINESIEPDVDNNELTVPVFDESVINIPFVDNNELIVPFVDNNELIVPFVA
jgi:hypothetical protein